MCSGLQLASQSARGTCRGWAGAFPFLPFLPRGTGVERPGRMDEWVGNGQGFDSAGLVNVSSVCVCVCEGITRVVGQRLGGPVLTRGNKVPDEALDVLVAAVMEQTVGEEGPADGLHIALLHGAFKTAVGQDVVPPSPPKDGETDRPVSTRPSPKQPRMGHRGLPTADGPGSQGHTAYCAHTGSPLTLTPCSFLLSFTNETSVVAPGLCNNTFPPQNATSSLLHFISLIHLLFLLFFD